MQAQRTVIHIIGTKHICELPGDCDDQCPGESFITARLDIIQPDLVVCEGGYDNELRRPYPMDSDLGIRPSLYSSVWARRNSREIDFADLQTELPDHSTWEEISLAREKAIADQIKRLADTYKRVVLFIGENHRLSIAKLLQGYDVCSQKMPWISDEDYRQALEDGRIFNREHVNRSPDQSM